jgi:type I restriction enzyme S subunit
VGDVIFAKMQNSLKVIKITEKEKEFVYSTGFYSFNDQRVLPDYLKHYFNSNQFTQIKDKFSKGATMKAINDSGMEQISINVPTINEQQSIVATLDKINELIDANKRHLELLDELKTSKFVEMFGDPVINNNNLAMVPLGLLGQLERGRSRHRPRNDAILLGGPYPLIQTGDIANADNYVTQYSSTYSEIGLKQSRIWKKGTLCITIAANIAKTAILDFDACFPDSVVGYHPNKSVTTMFIHNWFKFIQPILENNAPSAAQKNLNLSTLKATKVIVPDILSQRRFDIFANQIEKLKRTTKQNNNNLLNLLDKKMDEYFGGDSNA